MHRFSQFLVPILALGAINVRAGNVCIFFVGPGGQTGNQTESRFLYDLDSVKKSWSANCSKIVTLVGNGPGSPVVEENGDLRALEKNEVDGPASFANLGVVLSNLRLMQPKPDQVRLYFGDHGGDTGTNAMDGEIDPEMLRSEFEKLHTSEIPVRAIFDHCKAGKMLQSLQSVDGTKIFGCGMSTSGDYDALTTWNKSGAFKFSGSISETVRLNRDFESARNRIGISFSAEGLNSFSQDDLADIGNEYLSSSERFLDDYVGFPENEADLQIAPRCSSGQDDLFPMNAASQKNLVNHLNDMGELVDDPIVKILFSNFQKRFSISTADRKILDGVIQFPELLTSYANDLFAAHVQTLPRSSPAAKLVTTLDALAVTLEKVCGEGKETDRVCLVAKAKWNSTATKFVSLRTDYLQSNFVTKVTRRKLTEEQNVDFNFVQDNVGLSFGDAIALAEANAMTALEASVMIKKAVRKRRVREQIEKISSSPTLREDLKYYKMMIACEQEAF